MSNTKVYGELNSHAIAIIMKQLIERGLRAIVKERTSFVAEAKLGKTGDMDDVKTSADDAAQAIIVKSLIEVFPEFGIVAEEADFVRPCTHPTLNIFFTIDPLDGTKAFVRRQAHGVGSMISLVVNGRVIAAYVADVSTWDLFGYRPDSTHVHRIMGLDYPELLTHDSSEPLSKKYALLRDPLDTYSPLMQKFVGESGIVRSHNIEGGSIGISFTHLWIGYIGMIVLHPGFQTPWDLAPVLGISQTLGFQFLEVDRETGRSKFWNPEITTEVFETKSEIVVVHASDVGRVRSNLLRSAS